MKTILLTFLFLPLVLFAGPLPADYQQQKEASERKAMALYPESGVEKSPLWVAISEEMARVEKTNPAFFDDPSYPEMLASKMASKLGIEPVVATAKKDTAAVPIKASTPVPLPPQKNVAPIDKFASAPRPGESSEEFWKRINEAVASGVLPIQRPERGLPRNWIDPAQADANWNAQNLQNAINTNTAAQQQAAEQLRWKQQQLEQQIRDLQRRK